MQLYNALTGDLEPVEPVKGAVTIYVCGITPYDTTHLGHCFTYATFDVLIRYLEFLGLKVSYVQNVTDIDDDLLRRAREVGEDWQALGDRWTTHFVDDNVALNIRPPDHYPRATDVIAEIISSVEALLQAGVAYESAGNVYFQVNSDPGYGQLSRLSFDEMLPIANERGNNPDDPHKQDPLDFVLWQAHQPGEPAWDSPWGPGRPGWHIECSTMSTKFLGQPIDIHGGGSDLLFPHHESEIAQAEWATGQKPFTRIWLHIAMVRYMGEKMSKSLGNLVMVRDLLAEGWPADAIRLCMAEYHYREAWEYEESDLSTSAAQVHRFTEAVTIASGAGQPLKTEAAEIEFQSAMEADLDTPSAVRSLVRLADEILDAAAAGRDVRQAQKALRARCAIFGLRLDEASPEERVVEGWRRHRQRFSSALCNFSD